MERRAGMSRPAKLGGRIDLALTRGALMWMSQNCSDMAIELKARNIGSV